MEFGVMLPSVGPAAEREMILQVARDAEAVGIDSVWTPDHVVLPGSRESVYPYPQSKTEAAFVPGISWLDPIATLGVVAGATERLKLGTAVLILPQRNPVILAQEIATLDHLSGGRVELGVGVGWLREEFEALGADFAHRGKVTDEAIEAMRLLWSSFDPCSYSGEHVRFSDVVLCSRPKRPNGPPVWVGGHTPPALRRAARLADGWHAFEVSLEEMKVFREELDARCAEAGRDPATLRVGVHKVLVPPFEVTNFIPDRAAIAADTAVEELRAFAALGVDLVVFDLAFLPHEVTQTLQWFATEVRPALL